MTRSLNNTGFTILRPAFFSKTKILCLPVLTVLFFSLFLQSCEEDPTEIGKGLLPGSDFVDIQTLDTIHPVSVTMYDASVISGQQSLGFMGKIKDPYFGTTQASFVTQLRLKEEWKADTVTIDSIKLFLVLNVSGKAGGTHSLTFSEIGSQLYLDKTYYSNTDVPLTGFSQTVTLPELAPDSVNSVVVKLTDLSLANRLLQDTTMLFHSNTVPDFRSYFKGMQFSLTSVGEPVLVSLNLQNDGQPGQGIIDKYYKNFFAIYYHNKSDRNDVLYLIIDATNRNASFNKYSHDFSTADPDKRIEHYNNLSYRDTLTYIQSLNGLYTRILLPGLETLKKSGQFENIAVNKAHLTVPFYYDNDIYKPANIPYRLLIRYRTDTNERPIVHDFLDPKDQYQSFYNGVKDTINHVYNFNLATFVQKYLEDKTGTIKPELEIVQEVGIKNLILKANNNKKPVKFEFTYTRF
ncbi:MAG TPA: DUF4270 family protein [Bacteroidales bacterium]|nr:DUF4270 family protein [Bacteroidales bacterium]